MTYVITCFKKSINSFCDNYMSEKQTVAQMLGAFVREAAVLVAVFAPLDMGIQKTPFTVLNVIAILSERRLLAGARHTY